MTASLRDGAGCLVELREANSGTSIAGSGLSGLVAMAPPVCRPMTVARTATWNRRWKRIFRNAAVSYVEHLHILISRSPLKKDDAADGSQWPTGVLAWVRHRNWVFIW